MTIPLKIAGLGRYLPARVVPNSEVERLCGLPAGWVQARTGVRERRWASGESNPAMAAHAAREAIEQAGLLPTDIDLILNASGTQWQHLPDGAPFVQRELGLADSGVACFSVHATCLSFLLALETAAALLTVGRYRHILIVSTEMPSLAANFAEPESASLLGDAAAAAVVVRPEPGEGSLLCASHFETYSSGADFAEIRGGGTRQHPNRADTTPQDNLFHMNGPQLLRLTRRYSGDFLERLRPGLSGGLGSVSWVVPHQASMLGLRLLRHFGWPEERVLVTLDWLGNSVAASIPVTLYQGVQDGRIRRGDEVLLVGTGAGLSLGGVILVF
ncbi:MAG: beta-ketoacyl-ACP synthase III [Anaerolineae bacterium]